MNFKLFMLVFSLSLDFGSTSDNTQMILDLTQRYHGSLVAKLCWGITDKMDLASKLINQENSRTIQFVNNLDGIKKDVGDNLIIVLDLGCPDTKELLYEAEINNYFEIPFIWIMLPNENDDDEEGIRETVVPLELQNMSILIYSEVIIANRKENKTLLYLIYKIDSTMEMITEFFGTWTSKTGFRVTVNEDMKMTTLLRRRNLRGKSIPMSHVVKSEDSITELIHNKIDLNNIMTDIYTKSTYINIVPLFDFMNATKQQMFVNQWGYSPVNNTWKGMMGHMQSGEADLCGTMVLMTKERKEVLTYLTPTFHMRASFVFLAPPLSLQNNLFVLPFKSMVWVCVGAMIVVLAVVIYVNAYWERTKGIMNDDPGTFHPKLSDVGLYIVGAITQQGCFSELKGSLGRVVTFITLLSFLFLYTSYSANIVALLQSTSDQIRTLNDLLNSKLELGVEDQTYNRFFFSTETERVRKAIYEKKVARIGYKANFMDIHEGVRRIQTSSTPFAFHMDLGQGYKLINKYFHEHEKCGLREIEYLREGNTWFCCRKKSPYKEIYRIGIVRLTEHGITDRVSRQAFARKPPCTAAGGRVASVNMVDFQPVLMYWLYGAVASVIVVLLEIIVYRRTQGRLVSI